MERRTLVCYDPNGIYIFEKCYPLRNQVIGPLMVVISGLQIEFRGFGLSHINANTSFKFFTIGEKSVHNGVNYTKDYLPLIECMPFQSNGELIVSNDFGMPLSLAMKTKIEMLCGTELSSPAENIVVPRRSSIVDRIHHFNQVKPLPQPTSYHHLPQVKQLNFLDKKQNSPQKHNRHHSPQDNHLRINHHEPQVKLYNYLDVKHNELEFQFSPIEHELSRGLNASARIRKYFMSDQPS